MPFLQPAPVFLKFCVIYSECDTIAIIAIHFADGLACNLIDIGIIYTSIEKLVFTQCLLTLTAFQFFHVISDQVGNIT
jgi:hypothetical protein